MAKEHEQRHTLTCLTCNERPVEHENTTLCAQCDRDEWKDATLRANERFEHAETTLKRLHNGMGRLLMKLGLVRNYPPNYEELAAVIVELLKEE